MGHVGNSVLVVFSPFRVQKLSGDPSPRRRWTRYRIARAVECCPQCSDEVTIVCSSPLAPSRLTPSRLGEHTITAGQPQLWRRKKQALVASPSEEMSPCFIAHKRVASVYTILPQLVKRRVFPSNQMLRKLVSAIGAPDSSGQKTTPLPWRKRVSDAPWLAAAPRVFGSTP